MKSVNGKIQLINKGKIMSEQEEKQVAVNINMAEGILKWLNEEINDKSNTLMDNIDATIYAAIKLRDTLKFIDSQHIKEIIEFYEG